MQQRRLDAEHRDLLGELCPGEKKLEGKTFYLDNVKKRPTSLLLEAISLLGGGVESFLHKDVSFVVTGSEEALNEQRHVVPESATKGTDEGQRSVKQRDGVLSRDKQRPGTPRPLGCGSRGKALLEKAIRNNERLKGSGVLANARSWGVKILFVDDVLLYLKQLNSEHCRAKNKRPEKSHTKQQRSHVVKATALRSPYVKVEDSSRKYRPLHMQSKNLPTLCYSGRFSPFESPPPPQFDQRTERGDSKPREKTKAESSIKEKCHTPLSLNPSPWRPRKKDQAYCECCHQPFANLEEHLQSDHHRGFVLDSSNYCVVDQLVAGMTPGFNPNPPQQSEEFLSRPPTPLPIQDVCELEPITDAEMEQAVHALRTQDSFFNPMLDPSSSARTPPEDLCPTMHPGTLPAAIQPLTSRTECPFPEPSQPHGSVPTTIPTLDVEPPDHHTSRFPPSDPYSLPPVLSPQVPDCLMEPHSPYSEPPVLSPQAYTADEDVRGHTCEMDIAESVCDSVPALTIPVSTVHSLSVANGDRLKQSNPDASCPSIGLERAKLSPQLSVTAPNPKKRIHCSSPECKQSKRSRTGSFGTEHGRTLWTPQSDGMTVSESCVSDNQVSCQRTFPSEGQFGLKHPSTCCVLPVQSFSKEPNQIDIVGRSITAEHQPSRSLSSETKRVDHLFPNDCPHGAFSSQDSQQSLSHSTSVCIESSLIPDVAKLSPSSSDSDWDCELLSAPQPALPSRQSCELDKEMLHRPCTWMHNSSYESRLHTVLQPATPAPSLCGDDVDQIQIQVQIVEVQH